MRPPANITANCLLIAAGPRKHLPNFGEPEIEPLSLTINRMYGECLFFSRRYDESVAQLKKTVELDQNFARAHYSLSTAYQLKGNYPESVDEFAKFQELTGNFQNATMIRDSFAKGGWQGFLRTITGER